MSEDYENYTGELVFIYFQSDTSSTIIANKITMPLSAQYNSYDYLDLDYYYNEEFKSYMYDLYVYTWDCAHYTQLIIIFTLIPNIVIHYLLIYALFKSRQRDKEVKHEFYANNSWFH